MAAIILVFWRICTFRGGPDTVPVSTLLLTVVIVANAVISLIASSVLQSIMPPPAVSETADLTIVSNEFNLITTVIVSQASTAALVGLILAMMNFTQRLYQTLTALFGTDIIITALGAAVVMIATVLNPILSQVAFLGMFIWTVGTFGFILHKALEISMGFGIAAALFVMIFSIAITQVTTL